MKRSDTSASESALLLSPSYTTIWRNDDGERYVEGCGMMLAGDGSLLAAVPVVPRFRWSRERRAAQSRTHMLRSKDGGETWQQLSELPYYSACPWGYGGELYLFAFTGGTEYRNDDLLLLRSGDGGATWSAPVTLFKGHFWNCHTGMVIRDDRLYWAVDDLGLGAVYESPADIPRGGARAPRAIVCDLTGDPMDPGNWRMSDPVPFPGAPDEIVNAQFEDRGTSHYLEPNVIDVYGRLRLLATVKLRGQSASNWCAVLDITDDGGDGNGDGKLGLTFRQYASMPGGQLKFCIVRDEASRLFWAVANMAADSQGLVDWNDAEGKRDEVYAHVPGGDDRRFLMLFYSADGLNWFQAGCIARAGKLTQSFMYAVPVIAGDDLAVIARSSIDAPNRHDADCATFHRVRNFRRLALKLYPE
ncbi:MAG: exo-alpha-sialidase [Paenibacillaceae bacterium]|nr:exo-alpha-sialidase [Paenibacillaceae bacterium]